MHPMPDDQIFPYRWYMLALCVITAAFVVTIPFSCMPALFKEMSDDLGLSIVQIGTVWGMSNLAGIFVSLLGGVVSDRFGVKLILVVSCFLMGITGSLRGFSHSFLSLSFTVFLLGILRMIIPIAVTKAIGIWFKGRYLGTAMGISAMGMGFGLMLGPMISATVVSPLVGGWRNTVHLYGGLAVLVGLLWIVFGKEPEPAGTAAGGTGRLPILRELARLIHIKALWLLGFTLFFRTGCIMGMTGYLPLYLRGQGWSPASADGALAAFYAVSTICVVPLSSLSDRLGSRKAILLPALIMTFLCFGILPFVDGTPVWVLMILSGMFMDGFMAIIVTLLLETEGVGPVYSGTALGFLFTISQAGAVLSPPLGNSLAAVYPGMPFIFWSLLSAGAVACLAPIRER